MNLVPCQNAGFKISILRNAFVMETATTLLWWLLMLMIWLNMFDSSFNLGHDLNDDYWQKLNVDYIDVDNPIRLYTLKFL